MFFFIFFENRQRKSFFSGDSKKRYFSKPRQRWGQVDLEGVKYSLQPPP